MLKILMIATGLEAKDLSLLAGGLALVLGALALGIAGKDPKRRESAGCGWLFVWIAAGFLVYGIVNHDQKRENPRVMRIHRE